MTAGEQWPPHQPPPPGGGRPPGGGWSPAPSDGRPGNGEWPPPPGGGEWPPPLQSGHAVPGTPEETPAPEAEPPVDVTPGPAPVVLRGWTLMVSGMLAVVLGGLWTVQGLDLVEGSMMSGVRIWAYVGPVVVVAGLALIAMGVRRRTKAKVAEAARLAQQAESTPQT